MQIVSAKKDSANETYAHFKQQFCSVGPSQFTINALSYLELQIPRAGTLEVSNHTHWHTPSVCTCTLAPLTHRKNHTPHIQSKKIMNLIPLLLQ